MALEKVPSLGAGAFLLAAFLLPGHLPAQAPALDQTPPGVEPAPPVAEKPSPAGEKPLRDLGEGEYSTPRAGEGFRAKVLGRVVEEHARDRRSVSAWDVGVSSVIPGIPTSEVLPFGSLYFWRRPDEKTYLRAVVVGVYDEVVFAKSAEGLRPLEGVFTFNNFTVPIAQAESVDGSHFKEEELVWGNVRGGAGLGWRESLRYQGADQVMNMASVHLTAEPGYLYFDDGKDTARDFVVPQDTFEGRLHLRFRLDHMERNLFELAHEGFALGSDLICGWRSSWEDWGPRGSERASVTRDHVAFSGFLAGATGVPFVESDRHRILGYLYGGVGSGLDRFSGFRLGGGPMGDEYEAISRPLIPGAAIEEFISDHYIVAIGEYRWEPIFFLYPSLRSSVSYIDRRRIKEGRLTTSDDVLSSLGLRLTTGFLFRTQLTIDYNYGFGVIRRGEFGGHEVTVHIAGSF